MQFAKKSSNFIFTHCFCLCCCWCCCCCCGIICFFANRESVSSMVKSGSKKLTVCSPILLNSPFRLSYKHAHTLAHHTNTLDITHTRTFSLSLSLKHTHVISERTLSNEREDFSRSQHTQSPFHPLSLSLSLSYWNTHTRT